MLRKFYTYMQPALFPVSSIKNFDMKNLNFNRQHLKKYPTNKKNEQTNQ